MIVRAMGLIAAVVLAIFPRTGSAGEGSMIFGLWQEPELQAQVLIYQCDENLCGDLVHLPEDAAQTDTHNPNPAQRGRNLVGVTLIEGFRRADERGHTWVGGGRQGQLPGRIYVPSNGDTLGDAENSYVIRLQDRNSLTIGIHGCVFSCFAKSRWQRVAAQAAAPDRAE